MLQAATDATAWLAVCQGLKTITHLSISPCNFLAAPMLLHHDQPAAAQQVQACYPADAAAAAATSSA
jgi:hypothetical protein